jgi:predicted AAA+ superfamily ATPase
VGKTYILLTFGKEHYKTVAYFSMEESGEVPAIFDRDLNPERIVRELSALSGASILPEDTLMIFDEIQACERALASLKYFAENAPHYHVCAAGSLLGAAAKREKYSFPVGKVDMLSLYPMDFEEFLWAVGKKDLCALIREAYKEFAPLPLHEMAMDLCKTYLVVGGMPRVVQEYASKRDFDFVLAEQKALNNSYIADMAKYATPQETTRIMAAWESVPAQLAKENRKFQYRVIKSGARASEYGAALDWLKSAGMIHKCVHVSEGNYPLAAYAENEAFKAYMADTGLLCSKFGIAAHVVVNTPPGFDGFKGALAENYIVQALAANGVTAYYWSSNGKAEVGFVFQTREGAVVPLEAKPAGSARSKSLRNFRDMYKPEFVYRVSARSFGFENGIKSIPLYAVFCLNA